MTARPPARLTLYACHPRLRIRAEIWSSTSGLPLPDLPRTGLYALTVHWGARLTYAHAPSPLPEILRALWQWHEPDESAMCC